MPLIMTYLFRSCSIIYGLAFLAGCKSFFQILKYEYSFLFQVLEKFFPTVHFLNIIAQIFLNMSRSSRASCCLQTNTIIHCYLLYKIYYKCMLLYYQNQLAVMIRRRSTLDHNQKLKKKKQVETLAVLDLCLQISVDDRIIIRNRIKDGDIQLSNRIYHCKKDKDYQALQIYLRKYLQNLKMGNRYGLSAPKNRQYSSKRSNKTASVAQIRNIQTQGSFKNSLKSSFQSSPKTTQQQLQPQNVRKFPNIDLIRKKIEFEIDDQINREIRNQQFIQDVCRGVTPRQNQQSEPSELFIDSSHEIFSRKNQNYPLYRRKILTQSNESSFPMNLKDLIKQKMNIKPKADSSKNLYGGNYINNKKQQNQKQNTKLQIGGGPFRPAKIDSDEIKNCYERNGKFGQFYNRIKMTIESDL